MKKMTKLRLNNVKSINNLLARTINSFIDETISEQQARTIGYLANILYRGIEQADNLELNLEKKQSDIDLTKARVKSLSDLGMDIEDISHLHKMILGNNDNQGVKQ